MKKLLSYTIAVMAIILLGGCSDSPSNPEINTFSYNLFIDEIAPDFINTTLDYIDAESNQARVKLTDHNGKKEFHSGRFTADPYRSLFTVGQTIINESAIEDSTYLVGINFILELNTYDADGKLIDTEEYTFDNTHTVKSKYMSDLFPRTYEYAVINEQDGKYKFLRVN